MPLLFIIFREKSKSLYLRRYHLIIFHCVLNTYYSKEISFSREGAKIEMLAGGELVYTIMLCSIIYILVVYCNWLSFKISLRKILLQEINSISWVATACCWEKVHPNPLWPKKVVQNIQFSRIVMSQRQLYPLFDNFWLNSIWEIFFC